jgi:choline monooxygenase
MQTFPVDTIMSATLPHHYYHDASVYAYECEHIFRRHWWLVGVESSLAETGNYLALNLMKWPLVVVRDQQSKLRGFYNLCRHRAGPLVPEGEGRCRDFVCRYHGWRYACSGELLKTPGFEKGQIANPAEMGLLPVRVDSWNGMIFVCLDESAPDLKTWLGDIVSIAAGFDDTSGMHFDGDVIKPAAANWKTYGDNSCEGYHVGMVHKALGSSMLRVPVKGSGFTSFRGCYCILQTMRLTPKPCSRSTQIRFSYSAGFGHMPRRLPLTKSTPHRFAQTQNG